MFVPLILILIGVAALVDQLGFFVVEWAVIWPTLLIVLGIYMIVRRSKHTRWDCKGCKDCAGGVCKSCPNCSHCDSHK